MTDIERPQVLPPNVQMGIIIVITGLLYTFFGLTGEAVMRHTWFYMFMFVFAVLGGYFVYGKDTAEKLHFTTKSVPMANVILYGVAIGVLLTSVETLTSGGTIFIQQSTEATQGLVATGFGGFTDTLSGIIFIGLYAFVTANSEETLTRGFFNSIAENFSDNKITMYISKYVLIPLIFSLLHYFMWTSSGLINVGGYMVGFLILYHYVFGVITQFSMDSTRSIYTPIAIHTVYNAIKMLIVLGIITVGVSI